MDGYFHGILRAQGSRSLGDIYAKQFAGDGDLKALGRWYAQIGARPGDRIRVYWISKVKIQIENSENIRDNVSLKIDWSGECIG